MMEEEFYFSHIILCEQLKSTASFCNLLNVSWQHVLKQERPKKATAFQDLHNPVIHMSSIRKEIPQASHNRKKHTKETLKYMPVQDRQHNCTFLHTCVHACVYMPTYTHTHTQICVSLCHKCGSEKNIALLIHCMWLYCI